MVWLRSKTSISRVTSFPTFVLIICSIVIAACASTQMKNLWRDEAYHSGPPKKILVIAVINNATVRRMIESEFAKRFKERGITAIESFRILPEGRLDGDAGREAVLAAVKEHGIDALLLTRLAGSRSETREIPGMTITAGFGYPYGSSVAWGVYSSGADQFPESQKPTTQGYSHEQQFLVVETHLVDNKMEKLIWALQTETRLTGPPQEEIKPYVSFVSGKLFEAKIF
jgi:hypothetical protein